jgi:hypothetical protein
MTAMSHRTMLTISLLVLAAFPALTRSLTAGDEVLKGADRDALAKALAKYMTAQTKQKDLDKARTEISDEFDKLKKKLKRDPLALPADLGRALWESFDYDQQTKAKKAKVVTFGASYDPNAKEGKPQFEYAVWAPAKYNPKQAYPLILCIPEKGAKVTDHLVEKWNTEALRETTILAVVPMPGDEVAQWSEMGSEEKPGGAGNLLVVFREMKRMYAIDFDRVFLAGRGEGVAVAVTIASRFPDRFAGVIGRAGDVADTSCENFKNLPTFFAGGGAGATKFSECLHNAGYENCTIKPDAQEPDILAWMQAHPRVSNPSEVVLIPGTPIPNKAYWIEVPPFDGLGKASVKAKADRSTNTITIDGEGVTSIVLYFNDALVDMDKPVKVLCNGAEHVDQIPRNLTTTLNLMFQSRSDPGKLYTATKPYDLPAKKTK